MNKRALVFTFLGLVLAAMLAATPALAQQTTKPKGVPQSSSSQQVTGVLGSPGATTTISGKQLPPPPPKFGGVIKEKASEIGRAHV